MIQLIIVLATLLLSLNASAASETTSYGKITGIESRTWGMHIQTTFGAGGPNNCKVSPGDTYMYDFRHDNSRNGTDSTEEVSMLLAAFSAQTDISFHIYSCNQSNNRPLIGYIRLRR